jgi:hypothetical protein
MRTPLWLSVLFGLIAAGAAAQDRPDFSGHWVLADPSDFASTIARELTVHQSIVHQSVRGDAIEPFFKTLTVERRLPSGLRSESYEMGTEGGTVGGVDPSGRESGPNDKSPQTRVSVKWDGDRLVIETGSDSGRTRDSGPYTEHDEVWSLDAQGQLLITVTDRGSAVRSSTSNFTYRRG